MALSLLAHAACLVAITLFLHSRPTPPDTPGTTQVAMVFQPAPATVPAVPAAPMATPVVAPAPPEPPAEATPTTEPPAPPTPVQPQTASVPEPPAPPPVPTATPTEHLARIIPKPSPPPERTPPAQQQAALRPYSPPSQNRASPTTPPSAAQAQPTELAASRPAVTGPLIPPRPVAGMETNSPPAYPEIALRRGESGRVMLRVNVSAHGKPLEVAVAESSGYPILDEAALAAVRRWQFIPATQAGSPVAAVADVPVRFRIDN